MTREQHSLTVAMDQTNVQKCVGSQRCRMIAWMSQTSLFIGAGKNEFQFQGALPLGPQKLR